MTAIITFDQAFRNICSFYIDSCIVYKEYRQCSIGRLSIKIKFGFFEVPYLVALNGRSSCFFFNQRKCIIELVDLRSKSTLKEPYLM
jgi:hypothetical protein